MNQPVRHLTVPSLTSRDLLAVVAVADHGSLVAASRHLKTSQSALSRTVARVEKRVGAALFVRTTRRVTITPSGREFVAVAERMLNDLQLSLLNMQEVAAERRGQIIVSSFPIFAQQVLPPVVRTFREARPQVLVQLRTGRNPEVLDDVVAGIADFGITFADSVPDAIEAVEVRKDRLHAILPRGHRLARSRSPLRLTELRDTPMIVLPREAYTRRLIDGAAAAAGGGGNHAVVVPGFLEMLSLVRAGIGAGVLPTSALPRESAKEVTVRPLTDPGLTVSVVLVTVRGRPMAPAASTFRALVIEHLKRGAR